MTSNGKKALLLFASESAESGASDPSRLVELLGAARDDVLFEAGYFEEAEYVLSNDHVAAYVGGWLLEEFDAIYFRYWGLPEVQSHALALARYCRLKKIPYIDAEVFRRGSYNKINQYLNLFEAGVPFPSTIVCSAGRMRLLAEQYLSFPFVAKDARASRGNTNFLVESVDQLESIVAEYADKTFVLQQYIANEGDYRVFVTGDVVPLVIYRQSKSGYLNNTSQGASASLVPIGEVNLDMIEDAIRAAKFFGRDIAGVDMVFDTDGNHYCFEVNRAPQIEHSSFEAEKAEAVAALLSRIADNHQI